MKFFLFISSVCAILICSSPGTAAAAASLSVASPPDRSYVESGLISVVLNGWSTVVDEIRVSVNGRKQNIASKPFNRYVMCYDGIPLAYGMNKIKITGFKKGKKIQELTTQIFFRSDISTIANSAPDGFKRYLFHTDENEKECLSCHELDFRKAGEPQGPDRSPCYLCHEKMLSNYKFIHGPSAVWSCLMCHDEKARAPKLSVMQPVSKICANCHENSWDNKKYGHGPTAAGACTTCHNPHAADRNYFLRLEVFDLCTSCHEEIPSKPHVISSFFGNGGHPLQRSPNPLNPARDMNCASCHNPHGGNSRVFLNNYEESMPMQRFCLSCHRF